MRIFIAIIMIIVGLVIAFLMKLLVNKGCHHTAHCIEVSLLILAIISQIFNEYWQLVIVATSVALFRNLFRVIGDCYEISKQHNLKTIEERLKQ